MNGTVVVFSGGMDSTTLLYDICAQDKRVLALSIDYGQRHRKELKIARSLCEELSIEHVVIDLSTIAPHLTGSSLTDPSIPVPDGHYASSTMSVTVVPNRNMIFLSLAGAIAINRGMHEVAFGVHSGDHFIYADCREEFVEAMSRSLKVCHTSPVVLSAPYLTNTKGDICRRGAELGVPFERTWSCYKGGELHCGTCGTCVERREAFFSAGVSDPTNYLL